MAVITGTSNKDTLKGTTGDDTISGLGGDDKLYGNGGKDMLSGGDGKDLLSGGDGDDWLSGDGGNDSLDGGAGSDHLNGGAGDDRLDGGSGNDTLTGEEGADMFVFAKGGGADVVEDYTAGDRIALGSGIAVGDLVFRSNFRLINTSEGYLTFSDLGVSLRSGESLRLDSFFEGVPQDLVFADGTRVDFDTLKALALTGGSGNDAIHDTAGSDTLSGGRGDDTLISAMGDDTLLGGDGNDTLKTELSATALLDGGRGNDLLQSAAAGVYVDTLLGGAGSDTLSGEGGDVLFGGDDDDRLEARWVDHALLDAGAGNDVIVVAGALASSTVLGGVGDDIFRLADIRDDAALRLGDRAGHDVVEWRSLSIAQFSDRANRQGSDLAVGGLIVADWFASPQNHVERFELSDGNLSDTQIDALVGALAAFAPPAAGDAPVWSAAPVGSTLQLAAQ